MLAMRALATFLLAYAATAHAALGGAPEQFGAEGATAVSNMSTSASGYFIRDTTLATGTLVREFVSDGGVVFALSWEGPILPDLRALLGQHFEAMVNESARSPKAGRSQLAVDSSEVVIHSGGHMRAFEGSAWIPALLPLGFSVDEIR